MLRNHQRKTPLEKGETVVTNKAIIFDGDDTLWEIQPLFDEAKAQFADIVSNKLGIGRDTTLATLDEIDMVNVSKIGFSPLRFPGSLVETFEKLCIPKGIIPSDIEKQQVYSLGTAVFEKTPKLLEGAEDVLLSLSLSFRLILYTMGDFEVQRCFIERLCLSRYFDNSIHIVPKKDSTQLQMLLELNDLTPQDVWMVGNSLRSDIHPALQLNIKCIWVNIHSWAYDDGHEPLGNVFEVNSLRDILDIIK